MSLGPNHGYRFVGDTAILNAELAIGDGKQAGESWALQLWACDAPYHGGPLYGFKVAEAALDLPPDPRAASATPRLEAQAFAQLPAGQREYAMVLVLASGTPGAYDQVHDFSNYPARQGFLAPHFEGSVGYRIAGDAVILQAERVRNPRQDGNVSGSLVLELWALPAPYCGGAIEGTRLAQTALESIAGERAQTSIERRSAFAQPAEGDWHLSLMLREWTACGFVTRDFCNFAVRYRAQNSPARVGAESSADAAPTLSLAPEAELAVETEAPARSAAAEPAQPVSPEAELAVETEAPARSAAVEPAQPVSPARVSVQRASVEELAAVQGLNKKLAAAIVRARPFATLDQLLKIRGIGEKTLRQLRAYLTL